MTWIRDRALTLALMAMFLLFLVGQFLTGFADYNDEERQHGHAAVVMADYLATGHPWEALFENWESEFLQMAVFVLLTTVLIQKGSPESRRPGVKELVDTDPRDFADDPDAPWPVRRGGWILKPLSTFARLGIRTPLSDRVGGPCDRWVCGLCRRPGDASPAAALPLRVPDIAPVLVRIVPELAKRVLGNRLDGLAGGVSPPTMVAGIETRACAACRDRTLRGVARPHKV